MASNSLVSPATPVQRWRPFAGRYSATGAAAVHCGASQQVPRRSSHDGATVDFPAILGRLQRRRHSIIAICFSRVSTLCSGIYISLQYSGGVRLEPLLNGASRGSVCRARWVWQPMGGTRWLACGFRAVMRCPAVAGEHRLCRIAAGRARSTTLCRRNEGQLKTSFFRIAPRATQASAHVIAMCKGSETQALTGSLT